MQYLIFIFTVINIFSCNSSSNGKSTIKDSNGQLAKIIDCDQNYDSLLLRYANEFVATTIDLNSSLSSDIKTFLLSVNTNCLRKQTNYKYFIAVILAKLNLNHLKCCNQNYDLYQMREGASGVIINEFERLGGYEVNKLEILNSGVIIDYILSDKTLSENQTIADVIKAIEVETTRIRKGI